MAKSANNYLSIANKIHKEKISDDYPPSLSPSSFLSPSLSDTGDRAGQR